MIEKIYIARHGFRQGWLDESWFDINNKTGIPKDDPLADYGEAQSLELARHISGLPLEERPTAIFSSPYYRCLQTAKPISQGLGVPIYVEHGLSEWRSTLLRTGLHPAHVPVSTVRTYFPEIDDLWVSVWYPSRNGENTEHLHNRMVGFTDVFLSEVEQRLPVEKHARILFVSHAAPIVALARSLVGDKDLPFRPGCCSLTEIVPKDGGWAVAVLGGGAHLSETSKDWRPWGFVDLESNYGKNHPDISEIQMDDTAGCQVQIKAV